MIVGSWAGGNLFVNGKLYKGGVHSLLFRQFVNARNKRELGSLKETDDSIGGLCL